MNIISADLSRITTEALEAVYFQKGLLPPDTSVGEQLKFFIEDGEDGPPNFVVTNFLSEELSGGRFTKGEDNDLRIVNDEIIQTYLNSGDFILILGMDEDTIDQVAVVDKEYGIGLACFTSLSDPTIIKKITKGFGKSLKPIVELPLEFSEFIPQLATIDAKQERLAMNRMRNLIISIFLCWAGKPLGLNIDYDYVQ